MITPQVPAMAGVTPLGINPLTQFINYCMDFYGPEGIYDYNFSRDEIREATVVYMKTLRGEFCGDTVDRETVRDIVFELRGE